MNVDIINLADLRISSDRQRKEFPTAHIQELAESIKNSGLFHAPIVTNGNKLVAGDCRRRAIELLAAEGFNFRYNDEEIPLNHLPVVRAGTSEPRELYRIELEENIRRKNLTHIEHAQAIAKLHEYFSQNEPEWTNKDTAKQLAGLRGQESLGATEKEVADALLLTAFADDADIRNARTKGSAVRLAKRKLEQDFRADFGAEIEPSAGLNLIVEEANSLEKLKELEDETFDGIITDPPYGINAQSFGEAGFLHGGHEYKDTPEYAYDCYSLLATESFRICKHQAHCYICCDIALFAPAKQLFAAAGWTVWKTPIIWYKGTTAHSPKPDYGPKRSYECLIFANKGDMRIQHCGTDVIISDGVFRDDKLHPAEKPVGLYAELIKWSFMSGSHLLDPFCGVGPIFPAAAKAGCSALGLELSSKWANIARGKIEEINNER